MSDHIPNDFLFKFLIPNYNLYQKTKYDIATKINGLYLERIFNIIQEKHLQSSEQYSISFFQQTLGFLFNDPVIVNWGEIETSQQSNFEVLNFDTYMLPYDWASISHFGSKAYRTQKSVGHTIESNVS